MWKHASVDIIHFAVIHLCFFVASHDFFREFFILFYPNNLLTCICSKHIRHHHVILLSVEVCWYDCRCRKLCACASYLWCFIRNSYETFRTLRQLSRYTIMFVLIAMSRHATTYVNSVDTYSVHSHCILSVTCRLATTYISRVDTQPRAFSLWRHAFINL